MLPSARPCPLALRIKPHIIFQGTQHSLHAVLLRPQRKLLRTISGAGKDGGLAGQDHLHVVSRCVLHRMDERMEQGMKKTQATTCFIPTTEISYECLFLHASETKASSQQGSKDATVGVRVSTELHHGPHAIRKGDGGPSKVESRAQTVQSPTLVLPRHLPRKGAGAQSIQQSLLQRPAGLGSAWCHESLNDRSVRISRSQQSPQDVQVDGRGLEAHRGRVGDAAVEVDRRLACLRVVDECQRAAPHQVPVGLLPFSGRFVAKHLGEAFLVGLQPLEAVQQPPGVASQGLRPAVGPTHIGQDQGFVQPPPPLDDVLQQDSSHVAVVRALTSRILTVMTEAVCSLVARGLRDPLLEVSWPIPVAGKVFVGSQQRVAHGVRTEHTHDLVLLRSAKEMQHGQAGITCPQPEKTL